MGNLAAIFGGGGGGGGMYGPQGMYGGLGDPQRSAMLSAALMGGGLGMMGGGGLRGGLKGAMGTSGAMLQQINAVQELARQKQMEDAYKQLGQQLGGNMGDPSV